MRGAAPSASASHYHPHPHSQRRFKSTRPDPNNSNKTPLSLMDSATDLFVAMRWKAAHALTTSLSDDERSELLQRLDPAQYNKNKSSSKEQQEEDSDKNELKMQHSIAEAVAAARAQEAQRSREQWESERATLMREAEEAARARVESDLAILQEQQRLKAFEQWQQQVGMEKKRQEQTADKEAETAATTTEEDNQQLQLPAVEQEQPIRKIMEEQAHPILGPCVLDLGYKRLHVVSTEALTAIQVWEKQRIYRHDRAKAMAMDKLKTLRLGLPGVIGLHEDANGKLCILDGQHRVGMLDTLAKGKRGSATTAKDNDAHRMMNLDQILVEVYPQQPEHHNENHAQELFLEINKAEPVKLVDLPGVAKKGDRKLLTEAAEQLASQYANMFSTSTKCRAPHLNIDNLRDALFAGNVIARHSIKTSKQLEDWMLQQNDALKTKYNSQEQDEKARAMVSKTALKKATMYDFYLGLESSWYYN